MSEVGCIFGSTMRELLLAARSEGGLCQVEYSRSMAPSRWIHGIGARIRTG